MFHIEVCPYSYFPIDISEVSGVICYNRWVLSEGRKKLLQALVSHELHSLFWPTLTHGKAILSKERKQDNFESCSQT